MTEILEILVVSTAGEGQSYAESGLIIYPCEQGPGPAAEMAFSAAYFTELAAEHPDFDEVAEACAESIVSVA